MTVQIFIQSEHLRDVEVVEIEAEGGVRALREAFAKKVQGGDVQVEALLVFVEDEDDVALTDEVATLLDGMRLHFHRLAAINVDVRYAGRNVRRTFRPSATVGRVKHWAAHELGMAPSDAADFMLQVHGTSNRPDVDVHIGTLVHAPADHIVFDLVPSPRINGAE